MSSSYEEAIRCPECGQPGDDKVKRPAPPQAELPAGTMIHVVYCMNKNCGWYSTTWLIQVNPDGTIPDKKDHTGEQKIYGGFENHDVEAQRIINQLTIQNEMTTRPGGAEFQGRR